MSKRILIIGGCGFIGHNLALSLKEEYSVKVIDGLNVNNLLNFQNVNVENKTLFRKILNNRIDLLEHADINLSVIDARDYDKICKSVNDYEPDILIHLAAVSHANESNKTPFNTFDNSLRTLENSLDAIKNKKTHLIYLSSSMVYGNFDGKNVKENDQLNPLGVYAALKLSGEVIIKSYNQVFDLPYTIIRPSALYGERCVSRRVSQIFIENALTNKPITINGDGEEKLDFTYINDLILGIKLCIENKNSINQTFNITYGNGRKINELIKILQNYYSDLEINFKKRDKLMPERGTLDISKARELLNFKPKFPLEKGFSKYIEWYADFFKKNI